MAEVADFHPPVFIAVDAIIFNLRSTAQAGRRGFAGYLVVEIAASWERFPMPPVRLRRRHEAAIIEAVAPVGPD